MINLKNMGWAILMIVLMYVTPVFSNAHVAMQYYLKEDYTNAHQMYKTLQEKQPLNFAYNYNLAATHYKLDNIVQAKYYFLKALRLRPNHKDTLRNIGLINIQFIDDAFMFKQHWGHILGLSYRSLSTIMLIVFIIGGVVMLGYKQKIGQYKRPVVLGLFIYGVLTLFVFTRTLTQPTYGLVIAKKAQLYSGPSKTQTAVFFAHEGAEFKLLKTTAYWAKVQFKNGLIGWLPAKKYDRL
jgi:tetratricopeptide (TPR) repeat protein